MNIATKHESAKDVMSRLRKVYAPALQNDADRFYSYKLVSLFHAMGAISLPGDWAEFGVYKGRCARFISSFLTGKRKLHLFDSFEGLPADWIGQWRAGAFKMDESEIPSFSDPRIQIHKGWFNQTVPAFRATQTEPLSFLHIDGDLYSSAMDVLMGLDDLIVPGTILLFDEYMMVADGETSDDEHRALYDWAAQKSRHFEYLWRTEWMQVAVRVTA
ncbi:TylF/MycF/NovP-related O-methyltransferase [Shinella zoogloeoides]|uniref:TylF/MycF/NovP-related O-methyltransferase n=1 Tax=Shinella zoogloeoides TaxID=352475 RepID=UPI00273EF9A3|nr:TylF/MycF/NovP-related O-methyltransferase [Shinella zoogloeoides]WLR92191.1 TylF/MycF/NovP-related O-methyltransferase [Shinella zoogloeoides]